MKIPCIMDMRLFPLDTQYCQIVLESYAYNSAKVRLHWWQSPMWLGPKSLPDFRLFDTVYKKHPYFYAAGHWDQLNVRVFSSRLRYAFHSVVRFIIVFLLEEQFAMLRRVVCVFTAAPKSHRASHPRLLCLISQALS